MPRATGTRCARGRPRCKVIDEDNVGIYHVWVRCVRRAWLCGADPLTGQDWTHRKQWFFERLEELAGIFAVEACVWAVLSNHYHLILRNRPDLASQWSDDEVARRWWMLYPERKDERGRPLEPSELEIRSLIADPQRAAELRRRLSSVSWFMKSINEWFARRANAEEDQRGHFWQERFGCRSLLDAGAILACSIYVDLNEIRAELAATPEDSVNTSAYRRILARLLRQARAEAEGLSATARSADYRLGDPDYWMCPLPEEDRSPLLGPAVDRPCGGEEVLCAGQGEAKACLAVKRWRHGFLPLSVDQYLELLDWTGRQLAAGKSGVVEESYPPILERLGLQPGAWLEMMQKFDVWFHGAVGCVEAMARQAARTGRRWIQGARRCQDAFT